MSQAYSHPSLCFLRFTLGSRPAATRPVRRPLTAPGDCPMQSHLLGGARHHWSRSALSATLRAFFYDALFPPKIR